MDKMNHQQKYQNAHYDLDAEQAVLGSILVRNDLFDKIGDFLTPEFFHKQANKFIFKAMLELFDESSPIDEVTIGNRLKNWGNLDQCGGLPYLAELMDAAPSSSNIEYYSKIVRDSFNRRQINNLSLELKKANTLINPPPIDELISKYQEKLDLLNVNNDRPQNESLNQLAPGFFEKLERLSRNESIPGLSTGFRMVDSMLLGLHNTDLIILAGRPGSGKSGIAMNMANHAANQGRVLFYSLEMSAEQLLIRTLAAKAKVDSLKIRAGNLEAQDWDRLALALDDNKGLQNLIVNDQAALKISEVRKDARREHNKSPLSLIVVDYLQLMKGSKNHQSREQEISEISQGLKALAKELNIPIIALSQLNRDLEKRQDKRPMPFDLRDSGSLEQDANVIMMLYREVVYNENCNDPDVAELIIRKNREGATGTIKLRFQEKYTLFKNLEDIPDSRFA